MLKIVLNLVNLCNKALIYTASVYFTLQYLYRRIVLDYLNKLLLCNIIQCLYSTPTPMALISCSLLKMLQVLIFFVDFFNV